MHGCARVRAQMMKTLGLLPLLCLAALVEAQSSGSRICAWKYAAHPEVGLICDTIPANSITDPADCTTEFPPNPFTMFGDMYSENTLTACLMCNLINFYPLYDEVHIAAVFNWFQANSSGPINVGSDLLNITTLVVGNNSWASCLTTSPQCQDEADALCLCSCMFWSKGGFCGGCSSGCLNSCGMLPPIVPHSINSVCQNAYHAVQSGTLPPKGSSTLKVQDDQCGQDQDPCLNDPTAECDGQAAECCCAGYACMYQTATSTTACLPGADPECVCISCEDDNGAACQSSAKRANATRV